MNRNIFIDIYFAIILTVGLMVSITNFYLTHVAKDKDVLHITIGK